MMRMLNAMILWAALVMLVLGFWNRNKLPAEVRLIDEVKLEPIQRQSSKAPFDTQLKGIDYHVEPLYEYELYGLVVSYREHDGNQSLHKRWNDHLNMLDVCVVWSNNASSGLLNQLDFWNGQFTCNVQAKSNEVWSKFNMSQLSNNHLLSDDDGIRRAVSRLKVGDQIRVKGWLSSYTSAGGAPRRTSTTRTDTGNGACETIFVEQFDLLIRGVSGWRKLMWVSLLAFILSLIVHFVLPYRPSKIR